MDNTLLRKPLFQVPKFQFLFSLSAGSAKTLLLLASQIHSNTHACVVETSKIVLQTDGPCFWHLWNCCCQHDFNHFSKVNFLNVAMYSSFWLFWLVVPSYQKSFSHFIRQSLTSLDMKWQNLIKSCLTVSRFWLFRFLLLLHIRHRCEIICIVILEGS